MNMAVEGLGSTNIATNPDDVAKILTERLYPMSESYDVEFGAWITEIGDGWGFTHLRTDFLEGKVNRVGGSGMGWHTHPNGGTFSAQDVHRR